MNFSRDAVQAMYGISHSKQHQWEVLIQSLEDNCSAKLDQLSSAESMEQVKFLQGEIAILKKLIYHYKNPKKLIENF